MDDTHAAECVPPQVPVRFCYVGEAGAIYAPHGTEQAPGYATPCSAGLDLRACIQDAEVIILPQGRLAIPVGIAIEPLAPGIAGFVYSRSGLGTKRGLTVGQGVGVIDPDYRGEIIVSLLNTSGMEQRLQRGERIAQLVFQPFYQAVLQCVRVLGSTQRGGGGFGHTGSM